MKHDRTSLGGALVVFDILVPVRTKSATVAAALALAEPQLCHDRVAGDGVHKKVPLAENGLVV